jgi:hypothetical protein
MIKEMWFMKKNISIKAVLLSFLILCSMQAFPQDKTMITPSLQLLYFKNTDDQGSLQATLTFSKNRMEIPLSGMEISFYKGPKKELIASGTTDNKGIARLALSKDLKLPVDNNGAWTFSSEFRGNDTISTGTAEISIKDVRLEMSLSLADTVKTISVSAFVPSNGKDTPASGEIVKIYVPRMFSLLPIGEITLDEKGSGTLEFPSDLPGDKDGNLIIISKFEENEKFGNVEKDSLIRWGTPTVYTESSTHRALWTKTPPRWMIITLSVLLAGVWGHYLFAVISLIRIKIDAKRLAKKEYRA